MGEYKLAFVHDPKDHKPFKRKRFRRVELRENPGALPLLTLTPEEEQLLRKGLCSYDMNFRVRRPYGKDLRKSLADEVLAVGRESDRLNPE
jgi:hypothetical protein